MEATSDYKKMIKTLFQTLEPEGNGKVHKDTLKKNMKTMLLGSMMDDESIEKIIETLSPDKDGMISTKSHLKLFSMPQFSAEEAAATRRVLKKSPELLEKLMDSKGLAAKIGYGKSQEVEKIVGQLKNCYLENLDLRLKKEPPKSMEVVLEKEALLMKAIREKTGEGSEQTDRVEKESP